MRKGPAPIKPEKTKAGGRAGTGKIKKSGDQKKGHQSPDWESVFRAIGSPAVILSPDHTILSANDIICRMSGMTEPELQGKKCWEVFHGPEAACPPEGCPMVRALSSKNHETAEMKVFTDGRVCLVSCTPVPDKRGSIRSVIHVATDVTEQKKAERQKLETEERFRNIYETSSLGMALITPDFRFFSVNPAWVSMTGYSEKELMRMSFKDITHPDHLAGDLKHMLDLVAGKIPFYTTEKWYIRKDQSILWGLVRVTAIRDPAGSLHYFAAQIENITDRKMAEQSLLQQNQVLKTVQQLALDFASLSKSGSASELAVKKLMQLSGAVLTSFSVYDPRDRTLRITNLETEPGILEKVLNLLGKRPADMKIPVSPATYKAIISTIVGTRKTLTEVSFGEIPPVVSTAIQKITGIDHFIGIAYVIEGDLFGTSILAMKHGQPDPSVELLESFAHIVAVSLRRYRAEAMLAGSEEKYRTLVENLNDIIFTVDLAGQITFVSAVGERQFGYAPGDLLGKPFSLVVHPDDRPALLQRFEEIGRGIIVPLEWRLIKKDGSSVWVRTSTRPVVDAEGNPGFLGVISEISREKQAEMALRESEEKFRELFNTVPSGIAIYEVRGNGLSGRDYIVRDMNRTGLAIQGRQTEEILGKTIAELRPGVDKYGLIEVFHQVRTTGIPAYFPQKLYTDERITGWYENRVFRLPNGDVVAVYNDITERIKAEEELHYRTALLTAQSEATLDGILIVDENQKIRFYNQRFIEMWGVPRGLAEAGRDEPVLDHVARRVADPRRFLEQIRDLYKHPDLKSRDVISLANGQVFDRYTSPVVGSDQRYYGRIWTFRDITESKNAEEERRRAYERTTTLLESISDAFTAVGRDWRIVYINHRALHYSNKSPSDAIGKTIWEVFPAILGTPLEAAYREVMNTRKPLVFENRSSVAQGRAFELHLYPSEDGVTIYGQDITERNLAETEMRESEEKYRNLYRNAAIGIFHSTFDGRFIDVNPALARMLGYLSPEEAVRSITSIAEQVYADPIHYSTVTAEALKKGEIIGTENRYRRRDGSLWHGLLHLRIVPSREGQQSYYEGFVEDITERKRIEQELRESEQRYRNILSNTQSGYFQIDTQGRFTRVNQAWLRMHGYSEETEVLGKHFSMTQVDEDRQAAGVTVKDLLKGEKVMTGEFSRKMKDGSTGYHTFSAVPVIHNGAIVGLEGFLIDATERRQAQDALRESEEKYRRLFSRMAEGSALHEVVYDTSGTPADYRILEVNPAFEEIIGLKRDAVVGKTSREAYRVDNPPFLDTYARVVATGQPEEFEVYFDPMKKHFAISVYSVGKGRFATIFEDITERKQSEELRDRLIRNLAQKNAELDKFTYTVSHDLKSPLIAMQAYLSLLEEDLKSGDTGQVHTDIIRIVESADKLENLITTLLSLSRSGRTVDTPVSLSFSDIAHEAAGILKTVIKNRGVTLVIPETMPFISGDRQRLVQVMTNLLDNAVKFMGEQEEPRVEVGVRYDTGSPVFFVTDNGTGIKTENQPNVFGLFERFNPEVPGTGVGLATVKKIIEAHGGRIWVGSEGIGKGTTISFTLPTAGEPGTDKDKSG